MSIYYFFSGVVVAFPAGEAVGLALTSGFFSSFFSSFFWPFAGLEAGEAVGEGLDTTTGVVAEGEADGVGVPEGLFAVPSQAPVNAARAAKTVSRISLLIVFPCCGSLLIAVFPAGRDPFSRSRRGGFTARCRRRLTGHF